MGAVPVISTVAAERSIALALSGSNCQACVTVTSDAFDT
jgi:hypothetical protein